MNQENLSFARTAFSNLIGKALLPNSICYCEILRDNPIFKGALQYIAGVLSSFCSIIYH